eukprot:Nitzschia sp. Nitz4//scaffold89_size161592//129569//130823//NITZ4_002395-RA/size161592-snap-gene-0.140-mRNA-1//1//CDS//3329559667//2900//frame0
MSPSMLQQYGMDQVVYTEQETVPTFTQVREQIDAILECPSTVNWDLVQSYVHQLATTSLPCMYRAFASQHHDPAGRLLISRLLSRNPPPAILEAVLSVFPEALVCNPAAFFTASRDATTELVTILTKHATRNPRNQDSCPYPWLLSDFITVEAAQAMLQAFPEGVHMPSPNLDSFNLLDYILLSPTMVQQRTLSLDMWRKFKLVLVAAGCCTTTNERSCNTCSEIAPVQVLLQRVMNYQGFWENPDQVRHVLWLLHHLRATDLWVFAKQGADGSFPIHQVLRHKCTTDQQGLVASRALVQLLLEAHPSSASHMFEGKLPLHMAIENGWPCHDLLLAAYPEALNTHDQKTTLLPFQSAASFDTNAPLSLDVTFELLLANPDNAVQLAMVR